MLACAIGYLGIWGHVSIVSCLCLIVATVRLIPALFILGTAASRFKVPSQIRPKLSGDYWSWGSHLNKFLVCLLPWPVTLWGQILLSLRREGGKLWRKSCVLIICRRQRTTITAFAWGRGYHFSHGWKDYLLQMEHDFHVRILFQGAVPREYLLKRF